MKKVFLYSIYCFFTMSCTDKEPLQSFEDNTTNDSLKMVNLTVEESSFPYCQENPNPIGGGEGYDDILSATGADIHITSFSGAVNFKNTIESAPIGSVIYIDNNLTIDLSNFYGITGSESIIVPEGVTIASGRGGNQGADLGALIYTTDFDYYTSISHYGLPVFIVGGDNVRFTGLRFQGPSQQEGTNSPLSSIKFKTCIEISNNYDGLTVDNSEFFGWPYAAIRVGKGYTDGSFNNNIINNCFFHDNKQRGLGYGVIIDWGYATISSNIFEANRHDIAGSGKTDSGYEASCNKVLTGGTAHNFDMHAEGKSDGSENAGRFIYIHHNDFEDLGANRYQSGNDYNIVIRGRPDVQCRIENNRFAHSGPAASIRQQNAHGGFGNMLVWNNIYDTDDYLGWYVKEDWSKANASNFVNLPSSNDAIMNTPSSGSNYDFSFTFGDYDGDGNTDIYKLENDKLYTIPYDAATYGISANWAQILNTGYPISSLRFGFYNGDNITDIIRQSGNTIYVSWSANSSWTTLLNTSVPLSDLKSGDIDGNGIEDLFLANGSTWRVSYNSNSSWTIINSSSSLPNELSLGRLNANNMNDVFTANGSNFRVSYEATSSWTNLITSSYITQDLLIADFDGDDISDVIDPVLRKISLSGTTSTWMNTKTANFPINTFPYGNF